jgi:hypothetical protein
MFIHREGHNFPLMCRLLKTVYLRNVCHSFPKSYDICVTYSVDSIVGDEGIIMNMQLVKMVVMMKSENKG